MSSCPTCGARLSGAATCAYCQGPTPTAAGPVRPRGRQTAFKLGGGLTAALVVGGTLGFLILLFNLIWRSGSHLAAEAYLVGHPKVREALGEPVTLRWIPGNGRQRTGSSGGTASWALYPQGPKGNGDARVSLSLQDDVWEVRHAELTVEGKRVSLMGEPTPPALPRPAAQLREPAPAPAAPAGEAPEPVVVDAADQKVQTARALLAAGKSKEALAFALEAVRLDPTLFEARELHSQLVNSPAQREDIWTDYLAQSPGDGRGYFARGKVRLTRNNALAGRIDLQLGCAFHVQAACELRAKLEKK